MITKNNKREAEAVTIVTLSELVHQDHLLIKIDKSIDFNFIYDLVEDMYSAEKGRPSIDPVVLFKIVFIQYLFGIRSMRQTIEEIKVNLAYRWFLGLGFYDEVPHHSTFGKNYSRRFQNTTLFKDIFSNILSQAYDKNFIKDENVFVDSTHIKAYANKNKKKEVTITESLSKYEQQLNNEINEVRVAECKKEFDFEETKTVTKKESTTDPESGYYVKGEHEKCFAYSAQTVCDKNGFVLGSVVVPGNVHDSQSFHPLYEETIKNNENVKNVVADSAYKTPIIAKTVHSDNKELVSPYTRPKTNTDYFKKGEFEYHKDEDFFTCPAGIVLSYRTTNRNGYREYRADKKSCKDCPFKNQCTKSSNKTLTRHIHQKHIDLVESKRLSTFNKEIYKMRKETIERVFGDTKYKQSLGITTLRGLEKNQNRVLLLFACHNMKKMATWEFKSKYPLKNKKENNSFSLTFIVKLFLYVKIFIINLKKRVIRNYSLLKNCFVYSLKKPFHTAFFKCFYCFVVLDNLKQLFVYP